MADNNERGNGALPEWMTFDPIDHGTRWVLVAESDGRKFEVEMGWITRRVQQDMMAPVALAFAGNLGLNRQDADPIRQLEVLGSCQRSVLKKVVRNWRGLDIGIYNQLVDVDDRLRPARHADPLIAQQYQEQFEAARRTHAPVEFSEAALDRLLLTAMPDKFVNILFRARDAWVEEQREVDELEKPGSPTTSAP